ncbi:MAG: ATP-dependent helicase [Candidatus Omnitrophota bacterium]
MDKLPINNINQPGNPTLERGDGLNPSQLKAVDHQGGHLLIIAGPGTGKTHTLTCRIARLADEIEPHERILAITFTRKAAQEMRDRLQKRCGRLTNIEAGTFHQFCLKTLKEHTSFIPGFENLEPADPGQIKVLLKEIWPGLSPRGINDRINGISKWKSGGFLDADMPGEVAEYDQRLKSKGLIDFDSLLMEAYKLFASHQEILDQARRKFRYIFVDEYQDINRVQHALLTLLITDQNYITAIGDPNQAIYSFRGSDVNFFKEFEQDFKGARVLTLSDNYRSGEKLLTAAGQIIAGENLFQVPPLTAQLYIQDRLVIHEAATQKAEAEYMVHQIEKMIGGGSLFSQDSGRVSAFEKAQVSFGDIAILYRLNSQQYAVRQALDRIGFPYNVAVKTKPEDEDEAGPLTGEEMDIDCEKISLMTLHASKGLEFPVVFIIGCEQKLLPLDLEGLTSDTREERRLFYVGMTRAKQWLYLLRSRRRTLFGKTYTTEPSVFLADIEEELKNYEHNLLKQRRVKKQEQQINLF